MSDNHKHPNRRRLVVLGLGAVFVVLVIVAIINRAASTSESLRGDLERDQWPVNVRTVKPQLFIKRIIANGILRPMEESAMGAEVSAKIVSIEADLGDHVKKGQVLIRLDTSAYQLGLSSANAQYAEAKAGLELAADQYERTKKLAEKNLVSDEMMDQAAANLESSKARERLTKANQSLARRNLRETSVRSPYDGRVSSRSGGPGELVVPGVPIITVVKDEVLKIDLALSEMEIRQVSAGMPAIVSLPAIPSKVFQGKVTRIGVAADRGSGSFPVRVEVDNADYELMSGMRAAIHIELKRYPEAIVVTRDNIVRVSDQDAVFVTEENDTKTVARTRLIETLERDGEKVRVVSGLEKGDLLIVVGQQSIKGGSRVSIVEKDGERVKPREEPEESGQADKEAGADA
jgi:RND family efflux transporter MFP subunit